MKIAFLHLSDIHITTKDDISLERIDKITASLNVLGMFNFCILIISGDITQSGIKDQSVLSSRFIGSVCTSIRKKFPHVPHIQVIMVPGNHDIILPVCPDQEVVRIQNLFKSGEVEQEIQAETCKQNQMWPLLFKNDCFKTNQLFCRKLLTFDEFRIEFQLLNTAPFSIRDGNDKGLHYLPNWVINKILEPSQADLIISVLHHAPEWFHASIKNKLETALLDTSALIFMGHEHELDSRCTTHESASSTYIMKGGVLGLPSNQNQSEYFAAVFDTDTYEFRTKKYEWNNDKKFYSHTALSTKVISYNNFKDTRSNICSSYLKDFRKDEKTLISDFEKRFVFPRLERIENFETSATGNEKTDILTINSLLSEVRNDKRIIVIGEDDSGKTTLLKTIFLKLLKENQPLFVNACEFGGKKKSTIIKHVFQNIYGDDLSDFKIFEQIPKANKILIIDDVDVVKDYENVLFSEFEEDFGTIIVSIKDKIQLDIFERARNIGDTKYRRYKIPPFFTDKRKELISKILEDTKVDHLDSNDISVDSLDLFLRHQSKYITITPLFIINFVDYYCKNIKEVQLNSGNIFGKVFEASMSNSLYKFLSKDVTVEKAYTLIGMIAYKIHFSQIYPISHETLCDVIYHYNEEYDDDLNCQDFINAIINAKILVPLKDQQNKHRFNTRSQLAYFTARELNRRYHDEDYDDSDLKNILTNACFGINGDILLFITYLTDNIRILRYIVDSANKLTSEWDEFTLDRCNIDYLAHIGTEVIKVKQPETGDQEKDQLIAVEQERKQANENEIETIDIYDYNELDIEKTSNQVLRAFSLLSTISKSLPNFEHLMKKPDRDNFVDSSYRLPNRIFYKWAKEVSIKLQEIIDYLEKEVSNEFIRDELDSSNEALALLQKDSIDLLLEVYNLVYMYAVKSNTIRLLNKFDYLKSTTYMIQHLMILERQNNVSAFVVEAKKIDKITKDNMSNIMIRKIARHFLIHGKIGFQNRQSLMDAYFPKSSHANLRWLTESTSK
ncbi:MAG: Calcineurin-like phosphoesterase superfamily domain protein [Firmicutes bacterium ADurb.Bin182]|nr:MAG: Calcineurin-like phosphoesterase superfamily domain protein [Firmicutes bacterium ADurb.Bin182]